MIFSTWLRNWKRSLDRRWALQQTLRRKPGARRSASQPRLEVLEDRCLLTAIDVTSTADINAPGTLIYAINHVNLGNYNEIDFNIGNVGSAQTINLTSQLPALTASGVIINGLSQGGPFNTTPLITLNGSGAGNSDGLLLQGSDCTVSGLILSDFGNNGIEVDGSNNIIGGTTAGAGNVISGNSGDGIKIDSGVSGTQVQGNFIGTNVAGNAALANGNGIEIVSVNNTVGGTASGAGNLISGNNNAGVLLDRDASGNQVLGNSIGTNLAGSSAVGNGNGVEIIGSSNGVGGISATAGNVISGNSNDGVLISAPGSGNLVLGNYIGINTDGTAALANSGNGIDVFGIKNTVGGDVSGAGNVISGNSKDGVLVNSIASGTQVMGNYIGTNFDGTVALANSTGIEIAGINNTVGGFGLAAQNLISGNSNYGVQIDVSANGNQVFNNYIGTNANGLGALPNSTGIAVFGSNNTIGGSTPAFMNLISGNRNYGVLIDSNVSGIQMLGNDIGTDQSAGGALPNSIGIVVGGNNNTIGGAASGASNLISGNNYQGVFIHGSGNYVLGNSIGTNAAGSAALPNSIGIEVDGNKNVIGGIASGTPNLISGNHKDGVRIDSNGSGNQVLDNHIGITAPGNQALGNSIGIEVDGNNNTVGGTASGSDNIICGNGYAGVLISGSSNQVLGNLIGVYSYGLDPLGNGTGIYVLNGSSNTIGGTASGADNIISANSSDGMQISGGDDNQVLGNFIGTDYGGDFPLANGDNGVYVQIGKNNVIGGTAPGAGNIISGNAEDGVKIDSGASGTLVLGNYVGVNAAGFLALANHIGIEVQGNSNTVGGAAPGAGNLISGNSYAGMLISGSANQVLGNSIGTDNTGAPTVGNGTGIYVQNGSSNTIGGAAAGAGNLIAGNSTDGVNILGNNNQLLGNTVLANHHNGIYLQSGNGNTIGGAAAGAGNVISGNSGDGVWIADSGNQVLGNSIGTTAGGNSALANHNGIEIASSNNTIGGTASRAGNVISGNSNDGVKIDSGVSGIQVWGNSIGVNAAGKASLANSVGIEVDGSNNTVGGTASGTRNLISGNRQDGVLIDSGVSGIQVLGNYVGTDITGRTATGTDGKPLGNSVGIEVVGNNNAIGGTASGAGNLISGDNYAGMLISGQANEVLGNFIGVAASGNSPVADGTGIYIDNGSGNTIGGAASGARNLISGNSTDGVNIFGNGNQVLGNYIGTTADGTTALPNLHNGIYLQSGSGNIIGGTASGAGNLISGNRGIGVWIDVAANGTQVLGNSIGVALGGNSALANATGIDADSVSNTIGGSVYGAGNLVSGNSGIGVWITGSGTQVLGNTIGANASGNAAVANGLGIEADSGGNTIGGTDSGARNLISGNRGDGLVVGGDLVLGNYVGTKADGTAALPNNFGIVLRSNNTVGGTASGARNIISGNSKDGVLIIGSGNQVLGNSIGINLAGNAALANSNGIEIAGSGNTVGGAFLGNYISGNSNDGVLIDKTGSGNQVLGNYIGTDITGNGRVANGTGVEVAGISNTIGSTASGARNLISGNTKDGVFIDSGGSGNQVLGNSLGIDLAGNALANSNGLEIAGSGNMIGGDALGNYISGNSNDGVLIDSTGSSNQVLGNYIGTNITGNGGVANSNGIEISGSNNTVGGTAVPDRNLISGNSKDGVKIDSTGSGNQVLSNLIGTDIAANNRVANGNGIEIAGTNNTVGVTASDISNFISGNSNDGVLIDKSGSGNLVASTFIGMNENGDALGNSNDGIEVDGFNNTVGGASTAHWTGNLISGNGTGMYLVGNSNQVLGNLIGVAPTDNTALANLYDGIDVAGNNNTIGGTTSGARNIISGNGSNGLGGHGVGISGSGNQVLGNYIGTNVAGTASLGNYDYGIDIGGNDNTVGGTAPGAGNLISGNSKDYGVFLSYGSGNQVLGNSIGTNAAGKAALPNWVGVEINSDNNTIGGTASGARNIISGNSKWGVGIYGSGNQVLGNYISTDATGNAALPNGDVGIWIYGATGHNTVGGTASGAGNVISGNSNYEGVLIYAGASSNQVLGNSIGTNAAGNAALPNSIGIEIESNNNTIGGTASGARNIISGNSTDGVLIDGSGNQVLGNYIGTDKTGATATGTDGKPLGSRFGIVAFGDDNTIGGATAGAGNLVSGNNLDGVLAHGTGTVVLGNSIGTNAAGTSAVANYFGVFVSGSSCTVGGTVSGAGNLISGNSVIGVRLDSSSNQVLGNYIGTNAAGNASLANSIGIYVEGSSNLIGGAVSGAGNLISGNSTDGVQIQSIARDTLVLGNHIGTDLMGGKPLGNSIGIEVESIDNTIGGTVSGMRNLISGNSSDGVRIDKGSSGNQVLGNYIGTNATGTVAVTNKNDGISVAGSSNTIGGTASGARNLISGNRYDGVEIQEGSSGNQVLGNYIGTNATGNAPLANNDGILAEGPGAIIGGTAPGAGNLISGNSSFGVDIFDGDGDQVLGNTIGTNSTGNAPVANYEGIEVDTDSNMIGGTVSGAGNLISGNSDDGLLLGGSGNQVLGNSIGVAAAGKFALANHRNGIEVIFGSSNTIGGTASRARNLISGNSNDGVLIDSGVSGNQVLGNYIGTDLTGTTATGNDGKPLGNSIGIEIDSAGNTLGGTASGAGNLISGNSNDGVQITSSGNVVLGNYIGTNAHGNAALPNLYGIEVNGISNTIGGTVSGAGNLISGNSDDGLLLGGSGNQVLGNSIGVDAAGKVALANGSGIYVNGNYNTIGGTVAGARNVISGNSDVNVHIFINISGNQVLGNYIGINAAGNSALTNKIGIELSGNDSMIGGTASGAANLISGNSQDGIMIGGTGNQVLGNSIGTNAAGNAALTNGLGIFVYNRDNTIGGTASGAGNLISGNRGDGVLILSAVSGLQPSGTQVLGNSIGTDLTGTTTTGTDGKPLGNSIGIDVDGLSNTIGSTIYGAANVISGNLYGVKIDSGASGNQVLGNFIGTNKDGTVALGNSVGVYLVGGNNTIGGTIDAGDSNLISGNSSDGVLIAGSGNQVTGNYIGTDVGGSAAVANSVGIEVTGIQNTIGGTAFGRAYNLISGNSTDGVLIDSSGSGNQVLSNYIGTDFSFTTSVANSIGVEIAGSNNIVGGTASGAGAGSFISGNSADGVRIDSSGSGNQVLGNSIGINAYYNALTNSGNGVEVLGSSNTVGGTASGAVNIISGNGKDGVLIGSSGSGNQVLGNSIGTVGSDNKPLANSGNGVEVDGIGNTVGGTTSNASNIISHNSKDGVLIGSSGSGNQVLGNSIGTDFSGTIAVPNSIGVEIAGSNNTVGGTASGARNLISGNSTDGVLIDSSGSGNQVLGNSIGTDLTGNNALANEVGISVLGNNNTIGAVSGAGNLISGNTLQAVLIGNTASGNVASGNQVLGNYIGTNADGTAILTESPSNNRIGVMVDGNNNTVGGAAPEAHNLIAGNFYGVFTYGASNQVLGNYIGTNAAGTKALANDYGLEIAGNNNTVGGTTPGSGNLISGNYYSLDIQGGHTQVLGNDIGTAADGSTPLPNHGGIYLWTKNNTIGGTAAGASNLITGNSDFGVNSFAGSGNTIRQNSIYANGPTSTGPGIAVDSGSAPSLSSATLNGTTLTVKGTFTAATANVSYVLDFYANPSGDPEGKVFLGSLMVTPTNTGMQSFTFTTTTSATETNPLITATLTDASGNTSAFSEGVTASSSLLGSPPPSSPPPSSTPPSSPPPSSTPPSSSTPTLSPLQMTLEVALDTAAYLLQGNVPVLLELEGLSEMFLGQTLPPSSDLLSTILSDWSVSGSAGFLGLQLGINFADSVNGKTT